jgi:uncharacterized membrane protein
MKPLIVLLSCFVISLFATKVFLGVYEVKMSGGIAMSAMLLFTAIGHFTYTKGMAMMLPAVIAYKTLIVYLTGVIEIVAAIGLQVFELKQVTAWLLIIFFIMILPANIYAAVAHVDYQKATFDGKGLKYLWFRISLQILFILWTYAFCIRA